MIEYFTPQDAPSYAKHSSSFKSDNRCEEVHFVVGDLYDEVMQETRRLFQAKDADLVDYDVNWSTEGEKFVGVTCRDL